MKQVICETCGKTFGKWPSQINKHNFCSRECAKVFTSARMHHYNTNENPMNQFGAIHKESFCDAKRTEAKQNTYLKHHSRHKHREVAEAKIGRPLRKGEIVHHIDGNKHNNDPDNLAVMTQAEHCRLHFRKKVIVNEPVSTSN